MQITTLADLQAALQTALQIELFTIPPYLTALYSVRDGTNREVADLLQTVAMEEMLHMVLVANVLNAVGGTPRVDGPEFAPTYPSRLPFSTHDPIDISLAKFSKESIEDFMRIEKPERCPVGPDGSPGSIGQFYEAIEHGLLHLASRKGIGPKKLFGGDPHLQVTPENYYGGSGLLFEVHGMDDARRAIHEIIVQGEGLPLSVAEGRAQVRPGGKGARQVEVREQDHADLAPVLHRRFGGDLEPAHYFRFQEVHCSRYYQKGDTPQTGPRGPVFPVQWDGAWNMRPNPKAADYKKGSPVRVLLDEFNGCYTRLLLGIQSGISGDPSAFIGAVGLMYELKQRALELMRVPNPRDEGETTVGPSFEYCAQ